MRVARVIALAVGGFLALAPSVLASQVSAPAGQLFIDGAGPFAGTLGSNCVSTPTTVGCSDSPWLTPKSGPTADVGAHLRFTLDDPIPITAWGASYGDASDSDPDANALGGEDDVNVDAVDFDAPPAGDWVVSVFVNFEGGDTSGDATYYFRLRVGPPETDTTAGFTPTAPEPTVGPFVALLVLAGLAGALAGWRISKSTSQSDS
jgi:hypothetical protein